MLTSKKPQSLVFTGFNPNFSVYAMMADPTLIITFLLSLGLINESSRFFLAYSICMLHAAVALSIENQSQKNTIEIMTEDILKTLNLYSDSQGYNIAAAIVSDNSDFPGIDIAKFGETISIFQHVFLPTSKRN